MTGRVGPPVRTVRLGYIERCDEESRSHLITFTDEVLPAVLDASVDPFEMTSPPAAPTLQNVRLRPNQHRFALEVVARYGGKCAVCDYSVRGIVTAAHLVPKKHSGSDDARNGLPLCSNHHTAMDKGLWRVQPGTLRIFAFPDTSLAEQQILRSDLSHLPNLPHDDSLSWLWDWGFRTS